MRPTCFYDTCKLVRLQVVTLGLGAALSSYKSPPSSFTSFLLCMVTNLCIPFRNVLLKQAAPSFQGAALPTGHAATTALATGQSNASPANTFAAALQRLTTLNGTALIWMTIVCVIFIPRLDFITPQTCVLALHLGLCRTAYELASLMVLMQVDPVVHSSLDVLKRAGMTVLDLNNTMTTHPVGLMGTAVAFGSLLWYKVVSKTSTKDAGLAVVLSPRQREVVGTCARNSLFILAVAGIRVIWTSSAHHQR